MPARRSARQPRSASGAGIGTDCDRDTVVHDIVPLQSDLWPGESWWCATAPGTASGFKGVQQYGKQWRARVWIKGKGTPKIDQEAAWLLARWIHYPYELSSAEKRSGKGGTRTGSQQRWRGALSTLTAAA